MAGLNVSPAGATWNYDRSELIADGIVHVIGLTLGLAGAVAIIIAVAHSHATDMAPIVTYTIGLLAMLGFSAAYNMWPISRAKWVLRRFDHSAIYLMIAGTYTPFIAQMKSGIAPAGLLIGVWLTAIGGVVFKLLLPGRYDRTSVVLYLLLGWSGVVAFETVAAVLPSLSIWLLAAGGTLYSAGVIFHAWQSLRFQNVIWHCFVLVAACCHYSALLWSVA